MVNHLPLVTPHELSGGPVPEGPTAALRRLRQGRDSVVQGRLRALCVGGGTVVVCLGQANEGETYV